MRAQIIEKNTAFRVFFNFQLCVHARVGEAWNRGYPFTRLDTKRKTHTCTHKVNNYVTLVHAWECNCNIGLCVFLFKLWLLQNQM